MTNCIKGRSCFNYVACRKDIDCLFSNRSLAFFTSVSYNIWSTYFNGMLDASFVFTAGIIDVSNWERDFVSYSRNPVK
jgi:hypothetical protein